MEKDREKYRIVVLKVNGEEHSAAVKDGETLLDVMRDKLGLTGTKKGCNLGVCGACTVLVDGEPKNSCLLLAASCEGAEITTIEGVDLDGILHPLQRAFIDQGAVQCGFCTPGMILCAIALIKCNPDPSEEDIKEAFSGNLCRCTGYTRIIKAVKEWMSGIAICLDEADNDGILIFKAARKLIEAEMSVSSPWSLRKEIRAIASRMRVDDKKPPAPYSDEWYRQQMENDVQAKAFK